VARRGGVALSTRTDRFSEPSPWASPDPRPTGPGTSFGTPPGPKPAGAPLWHDVRAGLLTVAVTVLVGAPVGLLWAALAPRVVVEVAGEDVQVVDTAADGFIAVDAWFLAAVAFAGLVGGVLTWWLGRAHGPGVVLGIAVGGLAAAWIASRVGGEVDRLSVRQLVESGVPGRYELAVRLRSTSALLAWPIVSLLVFLTLSVTRGVRPEVSSG